MTVCAMKIARPHRRRRFGTGARRGEKRYAADSCQPSEEYRYGDFLQRNHRRIVMRPGSDYETLSVASGGAV